MEFLAAELGILKSGAAFAALSPEYPKERVAYILKDCGAPFLLDDNFLEEASGEPLAEAEEVSGEDGAFAVYTSGSTGNPKGILHSHASLAAAVARHRAFFLPKESDVQLSCASFSFVAMMIDIYTPLSAGHAPPRYSRTWTACAPWGWRCPSRWPCSTSCGRRGWTCPSRR